MIFIELFAGIGGFRYGLENVTACERIQQGVSKENKILSGDGKPRLGIQQFTCVWANEIDKYASQIYRKNFGEGELYEGDITKVKADDIPDHELLVGGFPCQSFSIAGKRGGFEDTRGTLFFEIARLLAAKRPPLLLLENVEGLLSHDNGNTFGTILTTLFDLGYFLQWQVLNSKNFGVPQNRKRVFIIGHLGKGSAKQIFPIGETNKIHSGKVANCLDANYHKGWLDHGQRTMIKETQKLPDAQRVREISGLSVTLKGEGGGQSAKTGLYAIPVLTPNRLKKRQNGRRFKTDGEPAFTLTGQDIHGVYNGVKIRRLTPTECERLQGFPDGWTEGISDTQRYKCLGNAVTTNVIKAIGGALCSKNI